MLRQSYGHLNHHHHLRTISESTSGIIFFGTPHGGADPQGLLRTIAENVARVVGFTVNETVLESLLPSAERLRQLRDEFGPMAHAQEWKIHCFQEDHGIKALGGRKVVEDVSSCLSDSSLEITQHIANDHMDMCRFSGIHDVEYRKVAAAIRRVLENTNNCPHSASRTTLSIGERQAYVKSLRFDQIGARHATIKTAHAKTCRWLLKNPGYQDWLALERLSEHNGFLWIKGNPGTGKSTLMKYILANAKKTMPEATVLSFFFNARGEGLEKSTEGLYRSLLLQLLENFSELEQILDLLPQPLLAGTGEFEGQWQLETLKMIFQAAVRRLGTRRLVCFVDALDECHEDDVRDMVAFFETLSQEAVQSGKHLQICFSSRHYPYISVEKCIELVLEDQDGHQDDLAHYLQTELKIGKSQRSEKIKNEVLQRANGIFLWVVLVVRMLQKEYDRGRIHALQKRLNEIPDGLDKLFKDILTRDARNSDDLLLCLQWILFAKRPLKREELYFAILAGTEPDQLTPWDPNEITTNVMDRFLLDCSKGLAELTKTKKQTVQFIHESVRDYLLKGNGLVHLQQPLQSDFEGLSHEKLKLCCQNYLKVDTSLVDSRGQDTIDPGVNDHGIVENETQLDTPSNDNNSQSQGASSSNDAESLSENLCLQYPFLSYAMKHIFDHAEAAAEKNISQLTFTTEFDFASWKGYNNILEKYSIRKYSPGASLLYIFAEKNLPSSFALSFKKYLTWISWASDINFLCGRL
ncbi:NACHT domain-containing protein [Cladophialophora immunda]|nr:NACHT domain-containing protein [Cladophialophora immunda]